MLSVPRPQGNIPAQFPHGGHSLSESYQLASFTVLLGTGDLLSGINVALARYMALDSPSFVVLTSLDALRNDF